MAKNQFNRYLLNKIKYKNQRDFSRYLKTRDGFEAINRKGGPHEDSRDKRNKRYKYLDDYDDYDENESLEI
jgi:hypothetical protein